VVEYLAETHAVSHRRACGLIGLRRSSFYYVSRAQDTTALRMRLRELALSRPRFGYRRLHILLRREGWRVNHKRTYRLYCEESLAVRTKKHRKRASQIRIVPDLPTGPNQRWGMDFVADRLETGHRFRALTIVDVFTRECLAIEADFSVPGRRVVQVLERLAATRGMAPVITVDNGSEFFSKEMDRWAYKNSVRLDFIRPGKPVENPFIESFNGRLRDECLNSELFLTLDDARRKLAEWQQDYNKSRPHSSLGGTPPAEFAARWHSTGPEEVKFLNLELVQSAG